MSARVAVVGATGAVGREMLDTLARRNFPVGSLRLMASSRSAGAAVETPWGTVTVEDLAQADPSGIDIALFSAGGQRSIDHAPRFAQAGAVVVDNSSAWRMHDDVPLVVAGVNDHAAADHEGIIANPNCTTMVLMMAVAPLHRAAGLEGLIATSYQSVSGTGKKAMDALAAEAAVLGKDLEALRTGEWEDPGLSVYSRPIAFNVLPLAGSLTTEGYTDEEWKLVNETRKILEAPDIRIEPACVRVPVMVGHGIATTAWFGRPVDVDEAVALIEGAPGVEVWLDKIPTPLDSAGIDDVLVGRIRKTVGTPGGISMWAVGDNLRKGAALNAVQVAELLI
ncbi:MAG: aspartate-semialdehyde dehydrogenase [Actinobacteria bacterium]|nr:aspartate-semialdehyde dehydrogenase [Actinomycetota bacterium]MBU1493369.1 aspartate-semialdehyde dehydrogenase [Actinomycetota bacterium]